MPRSSSQQINVAGGQRWLSPGVMLAVVFVLFTARWIWVAGIADYGWTYELGMRLLNGQAPYRDFVCTLPQLTSYTVVPFLAVAGKSLWGAQVHLYLWWLGAMFVGLAILKRLGARNSSSARSSLETAAVFLAGCLSFPVMSTGHAYNYAATTFLGLALLQILNFRQCFTTSSIFWSGFWAGLAILAKQNVGGVATLAAGLTVVEGCWTSGRRGETLRKLAWLGFGVAVAVLPVICYWSALATPREVFSQMFLDAGRAKGGTKGIFINALPILWLADATPHRPFWTLVVSGAVVVGWVAWWGRKLWQGARGEGRGAKAEEPAASNHRQSWLIIAAVFAVLAISALSIPDLPSMKRALAGFKSPYHPSYNAVLSFLIYCALTSFCVLAICFSRRLKQESSDWVLCFWLLAVVCGHATSAVSYFPVAAPVAIPLALFLFRKYGVQASASLMAAVTGVVAVFLFVAFPMHFFPPAFERLYPLPAHTAFAGTYAPRWYADWVAMLQENVSPRIAGHRTLWFYRGGPQLAFGGKPAQDVALLYRDTYSPRIERRMFDRWEADPPEFAVYAGFSPAPGSACLNEQFLANWLPAHYEQIWKDAMGQLTLWRSKAIHESRVQ